MRRFVCGEPGPCDTAGRTAVPPCRAYDGANHVRARLLAAIAVATLTMAPSNVAPSLGAQRPAPECNEWQQCRQLALDARSRGQYERFHDLAWRTVQTGPANDPALMYLLARAQSLSGRPRDALLMLTRLVQRGIVTDASTEEDFDVVRRLPGWPDLQVSIDRVARGTPPPALPPSAPPSSAAVPVRDVGRSEPPRVEEVAHFTAEPFLAGGLAYDAVSRRFLIGDARGRRVMVLGEGLDATVDLIRAAGLQFHDLIAFEIDPKRGDLWVASASPDGQAGAIHRLQLVSGRGMAIIESPPDFQAVRLIDLAIAPNGTILALDAAAPRVIRHRAGTSALEKLMSLDVTAPASITAAGNEYTAYVAHRDGILRLDLQRQRAAPLTASEGVVLAGFTWIRWHRNALVGVQVLPDGSRHVVRLQLNGGRAVTSATVIDASLGRDAGSTLATLSGDVIYYLVTQQADPSPTPGARTMNVVVRRVRLP